MKKGNVIVIGNSGVGKSTLINAVLGDTVAKTDWGTKGVTSKLEIYENADIPFRMIDTMGFEPGFFKERNAINAVKEWGKERAKDDNPDDDINAIWFCVDGTSRKLFSETINALLKATSIWKSVPIIVVITKSYSLPERDENIKMVETAFEKQKRASELKYIIPVVADTYVINDYTYVAPDGITELIDATNAILPAGIKAAAKDVADYKLKRKRIFAQSVVGAATTAAVIVGAVPIPFADALILVPVETAEIKSLASIYGIKKDDQANEFLNAIVEAGTAGAAAKAAIGAIKAIPGINIAAAVLNAVIAGSIATALGAGSIYAFEKVYTGEKTTEDIDWLKGIIDSKFANSFIKRVQQILEGVTNNTSKGDIAKKISGLFKDTLDAVE